MPPLKIDLACKGRFAWNLPPRLNIGVACSDLPAARNADAPAIIDASDDTVSITTFGALAERSSQLAAAFAELGVGRGDRVAIMAPQSAATALAHLATYKLGAIAVPLATQFGPQAIAHRLSVAEPRLFVGSAQAISRARSACSLEHRPVFVSTDMPVAGSPMLDDLLSRASASFTPATTVPDDPAMMLFTSGTTGQPKGALHGHRVVPAHLPGIEMAQHGLARHDAVLWTPSDWAWAGGLLNALLPALWHGVPVVAARGAKFETGWALDVIARSGATNLFMPATALRLMIGSAVDPGGRTARLRVIGTAGESLGAETLAAARTWFGVPVNEFYGQTECNAVIASSHAEAAVRPGAMGKPVAGHTVTILTAAGTPAGTDEPGEIAIARPDPVMFLGYWRDDQASRAKYRGKWLLTGDLGRMDGDGFIHFIGRMDDVITSSGYRIGPTEIEDCLAAHPAVAIAAVVGEPDPVRTEIVSAHVKLVDGFDASDATRNQIADFVRNRLSAHQYPRTIHFVDDIPLTESGKVIRRHLRR